MEAPMARTGSITGLVHGLRPSYADQDYFIRMVTGLLFVCAFFAVGAIVSMKEFSEYDDYRGREGNTFFYGSRDAITGSAGQAYVAVLFSAVALLLALVMIGLKWRMGWFDGAKALLQVLLVAGFTGALAGLFGNGVVQLGLGAIGLRGLFWALLPLLGLGAVWGVLVYAKEGNGTVLDI